MHLEKKSWHCLNPFDKEELIASSNTCLLTLVQQKTPVAQWFFVLSVRNWKHLHCHVLPVEPQDLEAFWDAKPLRGSPPDTNFCRKHGWKWLERPKFWTKSHIKTLRIHTNTLSSLVKGSEAAHIFVPLLASASNWRCFTCPRFTALDRWDMLEVVKVPSVLELFLRNKRN